ncbi:MULTISPECIES: hypothetical protein [unclassified Microcoleus]|uniref:hypothetical protein n=1 Tax=unclassified Microcoleus TaxID=2642155 RepID=UPI0025E2CA81|nr:MULTISPECIES: hypothetical protein [unclassified Microcoleus]
MTEIVEYFYSFLSRMIHFYSLNPPMCQLGVRNVGSNISILTLVSANPVRDKSDRPSTPLLPNL